MKNKNILLFSVTMLILLLGISIVSAADTNNSLPTSTQITKDINTIETPTITQSDNKVDSNKVTDNNKDTNIIIPEIIYFQTDKNMFLNSNSPLTQQ